MTQVLFYLKDAMMIINCKNNVININYQVDNPTIL